MSTTDKVKNALHLNKGHTTSTTHHNAGVPEGTAGPHTTRVGNAADPRVDSDLDSTRTGAFGNGTTGHTGTRGVTGNTGYTGTSGVTGNSGYTGTGTGVTGTSTTAGPHSSNLANKVDPRVDSDRDGSRNLGAATGTTGATAYDSNTTGYNGNRTGYTGAGATGHTGGHTATTGHHQTGLTGHTGTTGGISNSTNAGPHDSNIANKLDPRVDSDLDGRGNRHGAATGGWTGASGSHATAGSGTAQNTAGPHNSDLANKLDPRVDADMDGSTTVGGNKTYH